MPSPSNMSASLGPNLDTLIRVFRSSVGEQYRTELKGGADEPLYEPASAEGEWACIYFTRDYFSSALHEIAHWCVAGAVRRQQADYGYWYQPDGRDTQQQAEFERVEVAPQAYEWIFSQACGVKFSVSADNLAAGLSASAEFKQAIWQRTQRCCNTGLSPRPQRLALAFAEAFQQPAPFKAEYYCLSDI